MTATATPGVARRAPSRSVDLLAFRPIGSLARGRSFPFVLQVAVLLLFAAALYDGFFGSEIDRENLITWGAFTLFFWPIILTTTVLLGRAWCAVCPIGAISALANRFTLGLSWPRRLRNLTLSLFAFVLVLWMVRPVSAFDTIPSQTAWFFLIVATVAAVVGLLFSGRIFCQHICPISGPLGVISLVAPVSIEATSGGETRSRRSLEPAPAQPAAACHECGSHACYQGTPEREGCPWGLYPAVMGTRNRDCSFCLKCVKNCPTPGTLKAVVRWPFSRLWRVSRPRTGEALAILALLSVFLFHMAWGHGTRTPTFVKDVAPNVLPFLGAEDATYVFVLVAGIAVIVGLYSAMALVSSRMLAVRYQVAFALFAFAYLPLFIFRALGWFIQYLFRSGGELAAFPLNQIGVHVYIDPEIFSSFSEPLLDGTTFNVYAALYTAPILLGLLVGGYVAYRIARSAVPGAGMSLRVAAPHVALMTVIVFPLYELPYMVGYKVIGAPGFLYG